MKGIRFVMYKQGKKKYKDNREDKSSGSELECVRCGNKSMFYSKYPLSNHFISTYLCKSCYKKKQESEENIRYVLCERCNKEYSVPKPTSYYLCLKCKNAVETRKLDNWNKTKAKVICKQPA